MLAYEIISGAWSGQARPATGPLSASWYVTAIAPPALSIGQYAVPSPGGWTVRTGLPSTSSVTPERVLSELTLDAAGGVPDYVGTPQYDGGDASRVRFTDNTSALKALIDTAIQQKSPVVKIPAGHWGVKTGGLVFSGIDALRIVGEGIGVTVLDFVKEDLTGDAYVSDEEACSIAKFTGANRIEFSDLTIKATTKGGLVTGTPGSNDVYRGKVWGLQLNNCKKVVFTRVRVERFNYRGISIYGSSTEQVMLTQCEGFYNVGSGFWISDASRFVVEGGEFAYNGILGETGTGYGVTASSNVGEFVCNRVYAHHNYRKGIDSHGCAQFIVKNSDFHENVLDHIAFPNEHPPFGVTDVDVQVCGNRFSNGHTADAYAWLSASYSALAANGYGQDASAAGAAVSISDPSNTVKSVLFAGNTLRAHFNGIGGALMEKSRPIINIVTPSANVVFSQNRVDLQRATLGVDVYSRFLIALVGSHAELAGNSVNYKTETHNGSDYGVLFEFKRTSPSLWFVDNSFQVTDAVFMASTYLGARVPISFDGAGSRCIAMKNVWDYAINPYTGNLSANQYFLGPAEVVAGNVVIVSGTQI